MALAGQQPTFSLRHSTPTEPELIDLKPSGQGEVALTSYLAYSKMSRNLVAFAIASSSAWLLLAILIHSTVNLQLAHSNVNLYHAWQCERQDTLSSSSSSVANHQVGTHQGKT
jgi:hypothetical protein